MGRNSTSVVAAGIVLAILAGPWVVSSQELPRVDPMTGGVGVLDLPPRTGIWPVNITLYGDAGLGWGLSNSTIEKPGPTIRVYLGDILNLTLIAHDLNVRHNWFIDYNDDLQANPGEPKSLDFISGSPSVSSVVADRSGNWTYRCGFHPSSMIGNIIVAAEPRPVNITLIGDAALGWGYSNTSISNPGPPLVILVGTNVTLHLFAHDLNIDHTWFIDYNNDSQANGGEPNSPPFSSTKPLVWTFTADRSGDWTYRCGMHPSRMTGNIVIVGGPPFVPPMTLPLITGIMVGALGFVLVFAVVYHVRAVRAAKRAR